MQTPHAVPVATSPRRVETESHPDEPEVSYLLGSLTCVLPKSVEGLIALSYMNYSFFCNSPAASKHPITLALTIMLIVSAVSLSTFLQSSLMEALLACTVLSSSFISFVILSFRDVSKSEILVVRVVFMVSSLAVIWVNLAE